MNMTIIATERATAEQSNAITIHLRAKGWHWWHWLSDLWLLPELPEEITPRILWEEIDGLPVMANLNWIVLRVGPQPAYWGGCHPDSWEWMKRFWKSDPTEGLISCERPLQRS